MSKTIVVVDGEPIVRETIKSILEMDGYFVIDFAEPHQALVEAEKSHPALIITNVSLPGITGHDAMHLFKESCPGVPVLMVSGLPDAAVIEHWLAEDGFDAFPKPFTAQQFRTKVQEMLDTSSTALA